MPLVLGALAAVVLAGAGLAWADHGGVDPRGSMNPWLEALLWGALGLAAAMIVAIVVMIFTRAPAETKEGERPPR